MPPVATTGPEGAARPRIPGPLPRGRSEMATASDRAKAYDALLARFQAANPAAKPLTSSDPAEIGEYIVANAPPGTARSWLVELMAVSAAPSSRVGIGTIVLALAGVVAGMAVIWGVFVEESFLDKLAAPGAARGLVTFLFAFATIAVVLITVIATFWVGIDEVEKRGSMAKEVLAILIGIMGTILGFYFGSDPGPALERAPTEISVPN